MDPRLRPRIRPKPSALSFNLSAACASLLHHLPAEIPTSSYPASSLRIVQQWASGQGSSGLASPSQVLNALSDLSLVEDLTVLIAVHFRPLILDLTARLIPAAGQTWQDFRIKQSFHALCRLLPAMPELCPVLQQFLSILEDQSDSLKLEHEAVPLLLSTARLALAAPPLLHQMTPHLSVTSLHSVFTDASNWDAAARLLAVQIFSILQGLPEGTRKELEQKYVGSVPFAQPLTDGPQSVPQQVTLGHSENAVDAYAVILRQDGTVFEIIDVWILPLEEMRRADQIRQLSPHLTAYPPPSTPPLQSSDLHQNVRDVAGTLMLTSDNLSSRPANSTFILTPSLQPALNCIAQPLTRRLPILLSGPASSGKSSMLEYLSQLLHPPKQNGQSPIVTLQLGDHSSLDAKALIGTYTSSPTNPGSFDWVEGALTKAVRTGKWLVLDDIDKATGEILSVVKPLVEAMGPCKHLGALPELDLGPRGKVKAAPTFALFATRSVIPTKAPHSSSVSYPPPSFLGNNHWTEVTCDAANQDDVALILEQSFPRLSTGDDDVTLARLIAAWRALQSASTSPSSKQSAAGSRRVPTLRDLIKWCRRVDEFLGSDIAGAGIFEDQRKLERAFTEGAEIFLGSIPPPVIDAAETRPPSMYENQVQAFAEALGLAADRAWWTLHSRTPEIRGSGDAFESDHAKGQKVRVGRVELRRLAQPGAAPMSRNFALTKPSATLLERIAASIALAEPVLLVGETGTGKTTCVQHLASLLGRPMVALNLSQQTEASDLLGSFKPLEPRIPATDLHNIWSDLFERTFSAKRNPKFVDSERKALRSGKWAHLVRLWQNSIQMAEERRDRKLKQLQAKQDGLANGESTAATLASNKKRKTQRGSTPGSPSIAELDAEKALNETWQQFSAEVSSFAVQHASGKKNFVFSFVEGPLVKALREGAWVLLDEINLAASETLDSLASLLQSPNSSVTLFERGDVEPVPRHPNFRLFACMNPATDVGKKDLPVNLRSRFTELYVQSPDADREALVAIVEKYIGHLATGDRSVVLDVAESYAEIRRMAGEHLLADGANQRPHFSIRTLSRALTFAADQSATFGLRRALWEGFIMAFTLLLDGKSAQSVRQFLEQKLISRARNPNQVMRFDPPAPKSKNDQTFVKIGPFWLNSGPGPLESADEYILTESVQAKLIGLARAILARKSPVLIQGPTSAGKTSAVEYLARRTGHRFVRINNHEHTDVQEYLGSYASDPDTGRLVFHEGLLVKALRRGDWIVLDELNLAPTDVLEALNRLLDDNRELVIPETGEVVRPHPNFMLFATQNPPGIYAGRKVLSRAFRNRFLELHFDDVPRPELEIILTNRCAIPPSYAAKVVAVFVELQKRRQAGRVFDTKQAFVTLRDLFRWGQREAQGYQQLAENGYMLIAERARRSDDKAVVKEVIEEIMKVKIDAQSLYDLRGAGASALAERFGNENLQALLSASESSGLVWTSAMQRLLCLVAFSLKYDEPVLLVGETGAGKTSVCEALAQAFQSRLHTVNCHQNTDTADLLGGQRPLRNRGSLQSKARARAIAAMQHIDPTYETSNTDLGTLTAHLTLCLSRSGIDERLQAEARAALQDINQSTALFEWRDGPLVEAMRSGDHLLLDEISLADDSVLERLNSVLEPGRTLVLAERSGSSNKTDESLDAVQLKAKQGFQVVATMNPGGDYGKKELSPALRNRFTEIYVPQVDQREDILQIFDARWAASSLRTWGPKILDFVDWFAGEVGGKDHAGIGLRDFLSWISFMNTAITTSTLSEPEAFAHGGLLAFIDGVGALPATAAMTSTGLGLLRQKCLARLRAACGCDGSANSLQLSQPQADTFSIGPFAITRGPAGISGADAAFNFQALTTANNALKVLRALYVPNKAVLLEGSPGAGKTSLIAAIAKASGNNLTRINLSDQTELVDLFGADLPVEGGGPGEFAWKDAAFLRAMQNGEWVLLDEMNLASQSVLEGLNSCLDHRGSVYIPELGRSFDKHPEFRLFAAQNPHQQGGGRKGLPKSFLNRFTKVYVDELKAEDILTICAHLYPQYNQDDLTKMIRFNAALHEEVMVKHSFGRQGAPWEFNLRDLLRWLVLIHADLGLNWTHKPIEHLGALYIQRFRTRADRAAAAALFQDCFEAAYDPFSRPWPMLLPRQAQFGHVLLSREQRARESSQRFVLLQEHLSALEGLADCVRLQWLSILVGPAGVGKSSLVRLLAHVAGKRLEEMRMSSGVDTMDVLGTFEQVDPQRRIRQKLEEASAALEQVANVALHSRCYASFSSAREHIEAAMSALSAGDKEMKVLEPLAQNLQALSSSLSIDDGQRQTLSSLAVFFSQDGSRESSAAGQFEWKDGPLLRAMQEGSWLLLDDANLCSASVLDRLNSLFEPNGSLLLSERGVVGGAIPEIRPHPDFRLFMAIDPAHGELSRAMRNRGLEISLAFPIDQERSEDVQKLAGLDAFHEDVNTSFQVMPLSHSELAACHRFATVMQSTVASSDAKLELMARALPEHCLALTTRVLSSDRDQLLQLASFLHSIGVFTKADQVKALWAQERNVDQAFLQAQGNDIGTNPNLWDSQSIPMMALRAALGLVGGAFTFNGQLTKSAQIEEGTTTQSGLSLIQQSAALGHQARNSANADHQEMRLVFPLLQSIGSCIVTGALQQNASIEALELLAKLLGLARFLLGLCGGNVFDYSAGQLMLTDIHKAVDQLRQQDVTLDAETTDLIAAMHRQVKLTSGFAMEQVWRLFMPSRAFPQASVAASEILDLLATRRGSEGNIEQLLAAVDLVATLTLSQQSWTDAHRADALSLAEQVVAGLQKRSETTNKKQAKIQTWEPQATACLQLLSRNLASVSGKSHNAAWYTEVTKQLIRSRSQHISSAISLKQDSWLNGRTSYGAQGVSLRDAFSWANGLHALSDSGELSRPFLLRAAALPSPVSRVSLIDLAEHRRQCTRLAQITALSRPQVAPLRCKAMRDDLIKSSLSLLDGLAPRAVSTGSGLLAQQAFDAHREGLLAHSQSSQEPAERATTELLLELVEHSYTLASLADDNLAGVGQAYVHIATDFMKLYLPNIAIDPLAAMRTRSAFAAFQAENIRERLDLAIYVRSMISPSTYSPEIAVLEDELERALASKPDNALEAQVDRQPDIEILTRFFQSVQSFVSQILSPKSIGDLVLQLMQSCDEQVIARENSLQHSLLNFKQRLQSEFSPIKDLSAPVEAAITMYQTGLRALLSARLQQTAAPSHKKNLSIIEALVRFPTTSSTAAFCKLDLPIKVKAGSTQGSQAVPMLLAVTAALRQDAFDGRPLSAILRPLSRAYDQLFYIWSLDREHERKEQEDANSLFKSRGEDVQDFDDEKAIEAEFQSMFPEFADIMDDPESDRSANAAEAAPAQSGRFFKPEQVRSLSALHLAIFGSSAEKDSEYAHFQKSLVRNLLQRSYTQLSEELDQVSAATQLTLLANEIGLANTPPALNFYADPNVAETSKATKIVEDLRTRLEQLIAEWPEQMVLQHIHDRCEAILRLDSQSPVAKVLAALEQLLVHSEDWEGYANSSNSLSAHRSQISSQIVAWRRLELTSWSRLLETQSTAFASNVAEWWFRLYEVAVRGMQSAVAESEGKAADHIRSLISLLDQYIRSSNIGEFEARLQMVGTFGTYLELLSQHAPSADTKGLDQVAKVIFNATAFYDFYKPVVRGSLEKQRVKIEKEIRDYIQLASWRDVNIHALKQSAQKSHRKLHKCVRQFRDILRQPVDPILAAAPDRGAEASPASGSVACVAVSMTQATKWLSVGAEFRDKQDVQQRPAHLLNPLRSFQILRSMTDGDIQTLINSLQQQGLDDLATTIVNESEALAKATPALGTEENQKTIKHLTNRKRKAWTDLLREMKRIGLSPFVNSSVVAQNCDPAVVFQQPAMRGAEVASVQNYFYRVLKVLPKMRDALHSAQGDVPMAELQRGSSYCEHATSLVFMERLRVAQPLVNTHALHTTVARLANVLQSESHVQACKSDATVAVSDLATAMQRVAAALEEIRTHAPAHAQLSSIRSQGVNAFVGELAEKAQTMTSFGEHLQRLSDGLQATGAVCWTETESEAVSQALGGMTQISNDLRDGASKHVELEAMCLSTAHWIVSVHTSLTQSFKRLRMYASPTEASHTAGDRLISSILQIAQDLRKVTPADVSEDEDLADKAIPSDVTRMLAIERALRFSEVSVQIQDLFRSQQGRSTDDVTAELRRTLPFLTDYATWLAKHVESSLQWQRSLLKLSYCMAKTVTSLATQGFCKPPEQDDSKGQEGGEGQELEGGTGLGDGSGAKDITDQMEEDETVEELQKNEDDQEESGDKGDTEREKGAKEAEEDIDGNLEEVSADENDDGASEQEEQQEEQEIDDHVGDVDPLDPNAVDEKMWSGEQDDKKQDEGKDQTDKDLGGEQGDNDDDDSAAPPQDDGAKGNDDAQNEAAGDRKDQKEQKQAQQDGDQEDDQGSQGDQEENEKGEERQDDSELEPEEDAGAEPEGGGRKLDEQAETGENLDIDDDLKMSDAEGGATDDDDEDDMDGMDLPDEMDDNQQADDAMDDGTEELSKMPEVDDGQADLPEADDELAKNKGEDAMEEDGDDGGEDASDDGADEKQTGEETNGAQDEQDGAMDLDQEPMEEAMGDTEPAGDVASSATQSQGKQAQQGRQSKASKPDKPEASSAQEQDGGDGADGQDQDEASAQGGARGGDEQDAAQETGDGEQDKEGEEPNPVRSLGDALKEFRRNIEAIAEAARKDEESSGQQEQAGSEGGMPEEGDVEHVAEDEDAEMQAMGAADDEDAKQKMADQDQAQMDDATQDKKAQPPHSMDQEEAGAEDSGPQLEPAELPDFEEEEAGREQQQGDLEGAAQSKKALLPSDIKTEAGVEGQNDDALDAAPEAEMLDGEEEEEQMDPMPEAEREEADHEVESRLADFRGESQEDRLNKAAELWRSYTTLTSDLAFALCEQLRLILTPTLAARLNGDFRTGKRLNMRKIVPFIASDFAKDKIWLRRTKPSKREYQVLLALDDSRSMSENRSVHLAYQTLALVSGAMSRLEVGDVSILRFGESVETLHPFGKGTFGDESGAQVLDKLSFEQKGTNMVRLVEHTLRSLQEARETRGSSSSASELWQLQIIISDGVCQDHEKLRSLLRRANEQRVMIVFIIVDSGAQAAGSKGSKANAASSSSILSMSSVRYETDPTTGRMELKMDRYLDSFPFSYYVVLREAEALPDVLATTLRQWAEKIKEAE